MREDALRPGNPAGNSRVTLFRNRADRGEGRHWGAEARLLPDRWVQALLLPLTHRPGGCHVTRPDVLVVVEAGGPASCSSPKAGVFGVVGVCLPTRIRAKGHQAEGTVTAAVLEERGLEVRACPTQYLLFSWRKVSVFLVAKVCHCHKRKNGLRDKTDL